MKRRETDSIYLCLVWLELCQSCLWSSPWARAFFDMVSFCELPLFEVSANWMTLLRGISSVFNSDLFIKLFSFFGGWGGGLTTYNPMQIQMLHRDFTRSCIIITHLIRLHLLCHSHLLLFFFPPPLLFHVMFSSICSTLLLFIATQDSECTFI